MSRLILASTSRYRAELLGRLGLPFETASPGVDERIGPDELPAAAAARLAVAKARAVMGPRRHPADAPMLVIGADQVPARGAEILRKPGTREATIEQLAACAGQTVTFYTAAAVIDADSGEVRHTVDETEVEFQDLTRARIEQYVDREKPFDCAGGFRAEGLGIALFRAIRSEDPTALIGLPLIWLAETLRRAGLDPLGPAGLDPHGHGPRR